MAEAGSSYGAQVEWLPAIPEQGVERVPGGGLAAVSAVVVLQVAMGGRGEA